MTFAFHCVTFLLMMQSNVGKTAGSLAQFEAMALNSIGIIVFLTSHSKYTHTSSRDKEKIKTKITC